jgi:hypothetical protein
VRRTKTGLLRIDRAAAQRESHYDGKWLLRTSDPTLTAEDLAAAYKQLIAVERGWRDAKTSLGLRPVYHHREDRIRAHVQLCWLALLPIRVAETRTGDTWRNLRHELDRLHLVTFATADGRVAQRSALTGDQRPSSPRSTCPNRPSTSTSHHRSPRSRLTGPPTPTACSNTTQTGSSRLRAAQRRNPAIRVPTICGSQAGDSLPCHLRWHAVARDLLGLPPVPPRRCYVRPLNTWDRDVVTTMLRPVEQVAISRLIGYL